MKYLVTGDLHLTDRLKDEYRFGLFKWLAKQQKQYNVDALFILGDLTDQKDRHSAKLVNRIIAELSKLPKPVIILKGNHDYIDPLNPFFGFLDVLDGVAFVSQPEEIQGVMCIPHIGNEKDFVEVCHKAKGARTDYVFLHQCIEGAVSETGSRLSGFSTTPVADIGPKHGCYAGDIHKPQKVGPVQYVGAPYHIRFGDNYLPRVLLLEGGREQDLYYDCIRKWKMTLRGPEEIISDKRFRDGDQVKLTVELPREEAVEWKAVKAAILKSCEKRGLEVHGVDLKINTGTSRQKRLGPVLQPKEVLTAFCRIESLSTTVKQTGLELL